jgi:hypothetical protein
MKQKGEKEEKWRNLPRIIVIENEAWMLDERQLGIHLVNKINKTWTEQDCYARWRSQRGGIKTILMDYVRTI